MTSMEGGIRKMKDAMRGNPMAGTASLTVELPSLLAPIAGDKRLTVRGATLAEALDDLVRAHPQLRVHLFDESGAFREHVNCFWRGRSTRWMESLDVPVAEGDVITLLQAVSGG
jgi:sulfur-carrier protein